FVSPVVGRLATTGYVDVAVACVVFAVFYMLEVGRTPWSAADPLVGLLPRPPSRTTASGADQGVRPTWIVVGLLAGFCYAAKYTAAIAVPYALAVVFFRTRSLRPVLVTGACAAAMMLPYLVKNSMVAGNPVAPFFNQVFPNSAM